MVYAPNGQNVMLDALGAVAVFASLHDDSADPGTTGAGEVSGGSPAYIRKAIVWNAASGGSMDKDAVDPEFAVPAGTEVRYMGLFSLVTGGVFYGFVPINGGDADGIGSIEDGADERLITSPGHTLSNGDRVHLKGPVGESLPGGYDEITLFFVVGVSGDDFQVSLTLGGAAVDPAANGQVYFQKVIPEVFGSQGTLTVDTATLKLED